jgi:hypothetical protein
MRNLIATTLISLLNACGGGGDPGSPVNSAFAAGVAMQAQTARARACGAQHVFVTVSRVQLQDLRGGWLDFILPVPRQVDLLDLREVGVLQALGVPLMPLGSYGQVRLVLAAQSETANDLIHGVQQDDGLRAKLNVPAGNQAGLKLQGSWSGTPGERLDLVLDSTQACDVLAPAGDAYRLRPTIDAKIQGRGAESSVTPGGLVASHNPGSGTATSMNATITIENAPPSPSTYFWAQQFFIGTSVDHNGYFGLQTGGTLQGKVVDKMVIFSVWNAAAAQPGPGVTAVRFGGEGMGYGLRAAFDWKENTPYTFALSRVDATWWQLSITSPGAPSLALGRIQITQKANLDLGAASFTEYFTDVAECAALPYARASFSAVTFDGVTVPAVDAMPYGPCAAHAAGSLREGGVAVHETGISRRPLARRTRFSRVRHLSASRTERCIHDPGPFVAGEPVSKSRRPLSAGRPDTVVVYGFPR